MQAFRGLLGALGSLLGASWDPLGGLLGASWKPLGSLLEASWELLDASIAPRAPKRRPRGAQEPSEGTFEDPSGRISDKKIDKKIKYFSERLSHRILH